MVTDITGIKLAPGQIKTPLKISGVLISGQNIFGESQWG